MALNDSKSILLVFQFHDVPRHFFFQYVDVGVSNDYWAKVTSYSVTNRHKIASKIQNTGPRRLKSNFK